MAFLVDFFPVLLFFAVYFIGQRNPETAHDLAGTLLGGLVRDGAVPAEQASILLATAAAIVAITLQIAWLLVRRKHIKPVQWITFVIFLVFGGATIYFHSDTFIKWKPTVLYWLFGAILLSGKWLFGRDPIRALMEPGGIRLPDAVWHRVNLAWAVFFVAVGALNLYVAFGFSRDAWVSFKTFGLTGLTFAFAIVQALFLTRHMHEEDPETPEAMSATKPLPPDSQ